MDALPAQSRPHGARKGSPQMKHQDAIRRTTTGHTGPPGRSSSAPLALASHVP